MDTPASLPASQQVDDRSYGHQTHIPKTETDVPSKVTPSWIANTKACRQQVRAEYGGRRKGACGWCRSGCASQAEVQGGSSVCC